MCLMQLSNTYQYLEHENSHRLRENDVLVTSKGPQWALCRSTPSDLRSSISNMGNGSIENLLADK